MNTKDIRLLRRAVKVGWRITSKLKTKEFERLLELLGANPKRDADGCWLDMGQARDRLLLLRAQLNFDTMRVSMIEYRRLVELVGGSVDKPKGGFGSMDDCPYLCDRILGRLFRILA